VSNVVDFPGPTRLDVDPSRVLDGARDAALESVVVIGFKEAGAYFASSMANPADVLWMLETAKLTLLTTPDDED
jgi:hypothetical protein